MDYFKRHVGADSQVPGLCGDVRGVVQRSRDFRGECGEAADVADYFVCDSVGLFSGEAFLRGSFSEQGTVGAEINSSFRDPAQQEKVAFYSDLWEIPNMQTVKADDKQRIRLPDVKPGQVFAYETSGKIIKLIPVKPDDEDVPVVKAVRLPDGGYMFPEGCKPSREAILEFIRADRDRRT